MRKSYTIKVKNLDGWWSAVCDELCVSGFGATREAAITAITRSMVSTLNAQARALHEDTHRINDIAEFVAG